MNAVVAATVARFIVEHRGVKTGVQFLFDAVDPLSFFKELQGAGVTHVESFSEEHQPIVR